ncbi:dTDP-4-dehydrorhamnose reductase [Endozoicomonas numazuensis]|uniref:dTDP-4-dehydrorhamnose reductase n=1 Tax=Endozoicomonas numazuensis TaxID=1137799 RepID=A0A081N168_9GAMM|nr:dTDP-4-dehydrorhamnose reductase [Endozoicomonas numazuensis]KEQ12191.1 dTDP-4-dehydrorhamnose reductase [Endozoicomonas numazuensis]
MRVLITGANGQLGYELQRTVPDNIELLCADRDQLNITSQSSINAYFDEHKPEAVINAAAYTAVDKAETEVEAAFAVNAHGPAFLANACSKHDIPMIQVSTDFVFDGTQSTPYKVTDKTSPVSVYGKSKLQGEQQVIEILRNKAVVIRTAWVYSSHGNNFVKTMLRLMQEKEELGVVADQTGTPTSARTLASCCWQTLSRLQSTHFQLPPILHWTDAGVASWYDFAVAIQDEAIQLGLLEKGIPVKPIPSSAYPTPAKRPSYSVLDKTEAQIQVALSPIHWRSALKSMLLELVD